MKHCLVALFALLLSVAAGQAQTFWLKLDETGRRYGPFEFKKGGKVSIGPGEFTIIVKDMTSVEEKLRSIRIDRYTVREATLKDALTLLAMKVRADEDGADINFALVPGKKYKNTDEGPTVSASLNKATAYEIVKVIAAVSGSAFRFEETAVILEPK